MSDLSSAGKGLMVLGMVFLVLGGLVVLSDKVPFLGRLPGDIKVERENFSFYFPLATCLLISVVVSFLFWLFSKFK